MDLNPKLNTYVEVRDYLYGLKHHGAKYGLERMQLLAEAIDHPERAFPTIHVAGTNGKGSVCAMLEAIYRASGLKTGMYTSPHLIRQGERVQVNRKVLDEHEIVSLTRELQIHARRLGERELDDHPSFFEFMTAMAFLEFKRAQVDLGIIETGLGGRLDATNILLPEVSVITSISLDHIEILGDTIEAIAGEKAGIIKAGVPVVLGKLPTEAERVIRSRAEALGSTVISVTEHFGPDIEAYPHVGLEGDHQRINAATATLVTEVLKDRFPVEPSVRSTALESVSWPGRWQRVALADNKTLILDATHNPEGCAMLEGNLKRLITATGRLPDILVGTLGTYRASRLIPLVANYARNLYLFQPGQPRAATYEVLESFIPKEFSGAVHRSKVRNVLGYSGRTHLGSPGDTLVATGSIYLIGEMSEALFHGVPQDDTILQDPI